MKKILYILFAFFAMFISSCSNDDIEIKSGITVKVDPSGVVSPFTYEKKAGELTSFPSDYKLRIRCLVYNSQGLLVEQDVQYLQNYERISTNKMMLEKGIYTIVAISDVVEYKGSNVSFEYWNMTGSDKLATTKLTDAGYIGGQYKILGLDIKNLIVGDDEKNECQLHPQAIGALCLVEWFNIHTYSIVEQYTLEMSKTNDFVQLNENGDYDFAFDNDNDEFKWRLAYIEPKETDVEQVNNLYNYYYVLPMKNVKFRFTYKANGKESVLFNPDNVSLEAQKEYWFALDLCDADNNNKITRACGVLINGSNNAKGNVFTTRTIESKESLFIKDYVH